MVRNCTYPVVRYEAILQYLRCCYTAYSPENRNEQNLKESLVNYPYGEPLWKPEMKEGNPIRLYTISEISKIFSTLGMSVCKSYADYTGKPSSDNDIQLMVYSVRG